MLWRGARDWPVFLTGRSMIVAGGLQRQGRGLSDRRRLEPGEPPDQLGGAGEGRRRQLARRRAARTGRGPGRREELMPHVARFSVPHVDCRQPDHARRRNFTNIRPATAIPCPIGRAAASRCSAMPRIRCIRWVRTAPRRRFSTRAASPMRWRASEHPRQALVAYEQKRLPMTAEIVRSNRRGGPEGVIDAVEQLAPRWIHRYRQGAELRPARSHRARLCQQGRLCRRAGIGGGEGLNHLAPLSYPSPAERGEGGWPKASRVGASQIEFGEV